MLPGQVCPVRTYKVISDEGKAHNQQYLSLLIQNGGVGLQLQVADREASLRKARAARLTTKRPKDQQAVPEAQA